MTLTQSVFAVLMSLSPSVHDHETTEQRSNRLMIVAEAVSTATARAMCLGDSAECRRVWYGNRRELAAAIVALGFHESRYAQYVGEGRCSDGPKGARCDNGKARTYWQTWRSACPQAWKAKPGSPNEVAAGAECAARLLSLGYRFCSEPGAGDSWARAFGRYGGRTCNWTGAGERVAMMRRILAQL